MEYSIVNISDGKSYIGVSRLKNGEADRTSITVPYGHVFPGSVDSKDKVNVIRLRRFVRVIQKVLNSYSAQRKYEKEAKGLYNLKYAINIIHDYLSLGRYVEYESTFKESDSGKINFKQTIKRIRPQLINGNLFYDSFIMNKKRVVENSIVSLVQENIINHFMENGGDVLFGQSLRIETAKRIDFTNADVCKRTKLLLREELINTFNSRKQSLIRWGISYLDILLNPDYENKGDWDYAIPASSFWQSIVDYVFGDQTSRSKSEYGKLYSSFSITTNHETQGKARTQPDTIYEDLDYVFVIDSKMYDDQISLLTEDNLGKQFGYYLEAKIKNPNKRIVSILLLPHIKGRIGFQDSYIPDPHTPVSDDPDKITFIYTYPIDALIDDYYYGKRQEGKIRKDFEDFISLPRVRSFLDGRGTSY